MKRLFIILKGSKTSQYGVGTYVRQLICCLDVSAWEIYVLELDSLDKECHSNRENGIYHFHIPCIVDTTIWNLQQEKDYHRSVFYWLMAQLDFSKDIPIYCHFNFPDSGELARLFKMYFDAKILFTLHYMEWKFYLRENADELCRIIENPRTKKEWELSNGFIREKQFMTEYCDRVVTVSRHSYTLLQILYELPESKLFYMPHALTDRCVKRSKEQKFAIRRKYHIGADERIILFVGRLNADKGIYDLIQIFPKLLCKYPSLHLVISGSGNFNSLLKLSLSYQHKVTFTGYMESWLLDELYSIADVGIVPSYHEELGYVAIEMMMHGLPIICSNAHGLLEVTNYGECGKVMEWDKDNKYISLYNILEDWMISNSQYEVLSIKGRERYLKEYSLDVYKEKVKLLYQI